MAVCGGWLCLAAFCSCCFSATACWHGCSLRSFEGAWQRAVTAGLGPQQLLPHNQVGSALPWQRCRGVMGRSPVLVHAVQHRLLLHKEEGVAGSCAPQVARGPLPPAQVPLPTTGRGSSWHLSEDSGLLCGLASGKCSWTACVVFASFPLCWQHVQGAFAVWHSLHEKLQHWLGGEAWGGCTRMEAGTAAFCGVAAPV